MADGIITLLQRKLGALDAILDLTGDQYGLIQSDDMTALLDNIAKRQQLIDAVDELDVVIAALPRSTEEERAVVDAAVESIRARLGDIAAQDKRNEEAATARLESFRKEVKSTNDFLRVIEGYIEPLFPAETHSIEIKK